MKRSEYEAFFGHLYDMSLLETMEFIFCDDITIEYRNNMIDIVDKNHPYYVAWHGVAGK